MSWVGVRLDTGWSQSNEIRAKSGLQQLIKVLNFKSLTTMPSKVSLLQ